MTKILRLWSQAAPQEVEHKIFFTKYLTKGVDLKGTTMARKPTEKHKQCLKGKGKATLTSEQFCTLKFKQEPEEKVDSVFRTKIKDE